MPVYVGGTQTLGGTQVERGFCVALKFRLNVTPLPTPGSYVVGGSAISDVKRDRYSHKHNAKGGGPENPVLTKKNHKTNLQKYGTTTQK
jgi:hypothetical protein